MSGLDIEGVVQGHPGLLEARRLAQRIVEILADGKAQDTVLIDVSAVTVIADFFVITTGTTDRQVRALANRVLEELKTSGVEPRR
ncbi:MAG: RsfS/YbeB/iojap family protein, partial [Chloroflexi bacterium]|nr:RsfS/YbeB/iojap family protein [Chloroflexota bacterium]